MASSPWPFFQQRSHENYGSSGCTKCLDTVCQQCHQNKICNTPLCLTNPPLTITTTITNEPSSSFSQWGLATKATRRCTPATTLRLVTSPWTDSALQMTPLWWWAKNIILSFTSREDIRNPRIKTSTPKTIPVTKVSNNYADWVVKRRKRKREDVPPKLPKLNSILRGCLND